MLERDSDLAKLFISALHGGEPAKVDRLLTEVNGLAEAVNQPWCCLLYTSPSPRDQRGARMPSSA